MRAGHQIGSIDGESGLQLHSMGVPLTFWVGEKDMSSGAPPLRCCRWLLPNDGLLAPDG